MIPPTFRQRRRYILVRIVPPWLEPDAKALYSAVMEASASLWGDGITAMMQPAVVLVGTGYFIARCTRGEEDRLATALSTVISVNGHDVAFRTLARSGSILSLKRRIARMPMRMERFQLNRGQERLEAVRCAGQKIDLIEKGIKNRKLLFFTDKESEEI